MAELPEAAWMGVALALAGARLGQTAPNPSVGCILVRDGEIIAAGVTGRGGRPHAEELALAQAGVQARGAIAYVTLEPCAKRSSGAQSCAQRLIAAGVARVIAAVEDPHANAAGAGIAMLHAAGIAVSLGVERAAAQALNWGFFTLVRTGRPLAALSAEPDGYDCELALDPGETAAAALDRLGRQGITRVFARPGLDAARALAAEGLITPPPQPSPPC